MTILVLSAASAVMSACGTLLLTLPGETGALQITRITVLLGIAAAICWIDARERRIPDRITGPTAAAIPASLLASGEHGALGLAVLGALTLGGAYLMIACIGTMGFGDVKLAALIGAIVLPAGGWMTLLIASAAPYAFAIPHALVNIIRHRRGASDAAALPFGPYLIAGALCALGPGLLITFFNSMPDLAFPSTATILLLCRSQRMTARRAHDNLIR